MRTLERLSSTLLLRLEQGENSAQCIDVVFGTDQFNRMYLLDAPSEFNNPFYGVPGAAWAERARDLAMREIANPSLSTMMVCVAFTVLDCLSLILNHRQWFLYVNIPSLWTSMLWPLSSSEAVFAS